MRRYAKTPAKQAFDILLSFPKGFLMDLRIHSLYYGSIIGNTEVAICSESSVFDSATLMKPGACP